MKQWVAAEADRKLDGDEPSPPDDPGSGTEAALLRQLAMQNEAS